jgi:acetyl esterase/lipase
VKINTNTGLTASQEAAWGNQAPIVAALLRNAGVDRVELVGHSAGGHRLAALAELVLNAVDSAEQQYRYTLVELRHDVDRLLDNADSKSASGHDTATTSARVQQAAITLKALTQYAAVALKLYADARREGELS